MDAAAAWGSQRATQTQERAGGVGSQQLSPGRTGSSGSQETLLSGDPV